MKVRGWETFKGQNGKLWIWKMLKGGESERRNRYIDEEDRKKTVWRREGKGRGDRVTE